MPQPRVYESDAERQAAYRQRLAERQAVAGSHAIVTRLAELERALAAETRRADKAEKTVADLRRRLAATENRAAQAETKLRQQTRRPLPVPAGQTTMNRAGRRKAQRRQPRPR